MVSNKIMKDKTKKLYQKPYQIEETQLEEIQMPYAMWLGEIKGFGTKMISTLLSDGKTPADLYAMPLKMWEAVLPKGRQKLLPAIEQAYKKNPRYAYEKLRAQGISYTCLGAAQYPKRLLQIPDAPFGLYYRGRLPDTEAPAIAVIGARNCSPYGEYMAEKLSRELAEAGVQIISGMARGIDGISQQAALEAQGYSLGVLGCGVDICYPPENAKLYQQLIKNGGVCSEYPLGTSPQSFLFPKRNRIISGMADGVLVIQARQKSGTLITVDMALEQGKEVFALPGRATEALSEGCNRLIKQGACMVTDTQDILQELSLSVTKPDTGKRMINKKAAAFDRKEKNSLEQEIYDVLEAEPKLVEEIRKELFQKGKEGIPVTEILSTLMKLELEGKIRRMGNGSFAI